MSQPTLVSADAVADPEFARQRALDGLRLTDSLPEPAYDAVVRIASAVCGVPISLISLIDRDRQWFKARLGLDVQETPRSMAFCDHAIRTPDALLEVPDAALDARFRENPLVTGPPNVRFYAGMPLVDSGGHALGTLCVLDEVPRHLDDAQRDALMALADIVRELLESRRKSLEAERALVDRELAYRRLERYRSHLEQQLARDSLTGLLSRAETERRTRALGGGDASDAFALAVLDLDHFKRINDEHGHAAGDRALKLVGHAINSHVCAEDIAGRYGGEEFLVVLARGDRDEMLSTLDRVRVAIEDLRLPFELRVSIGVAFGNRSDDSVESMFERADRALYEAKNKGRNRIEVDGG